MILHYLIAKCTWACPTLPWSLGMGSCRVMYYMTSLGMNDCVTWCTMTSLGMNDCVTWYTTCHNKEQVAQPLHTPGKVLLTGWSIRGGKDATLHSKPAEEDIQTLLMRDGLHLVPYPGLQTDCSICCKQASLKAFLVSSAAWPSGV